MSGKEKTVCAKCGDIAEVVRGSYHFREIGLDNVILQGIEIIRCKS